MFRVNTLIDKYIVHLFNHTSIGEVQTCGELYGCMDHLTKPYRVCRYKLDGLNFSDEWLATLFRKWKIPHSNLGRETD